MSVPKKQLRGRGVHLSIWKNRVDLDVSFERNPVLNLTLFVRADRIVVQFPDGRRQHLVLSMGEGGGSYQTKKRTYMPWALSHKPHGGLLKNEKKKGKV